MIDPELAAFALVAAILTAIPSADMALVARSVLTGGRRAGYVTSLGICTGLWGHAVASALGISALLVTSAALFAAVKITGAVYLVALGVSSLRRALNGRPGAPPSPGAVRAYDAGRAFAQGLLSNLLNPKVAVMRRPRVQRVLEGVTGTVLVGLGVRLAWERGH